MRTWGIASWSSTVTGTACADVMLQSFIIKPDDEPGLCGLSIPYCQWQYSTVYATRVSTKPSLREWLSTALFCSYRPRWFDIPRKMLKQLSNNLLSLVSLNANVLPVTNLFFRLFLRQVIVFAVKYLICFAFHEIAGRVPGVTCWRANCESQDSSGDMMSLLHPHA